MNKYKKHLIVIGILLLISYLIGFTLNSIVLNQFRCALNIDAILDKNTFIYTLIIFVILILLFLEDYRKHFFLRNSKKLINEKSDLEKSRFLTEKEVNTLFHNYHYQELSDKEINGTVIKTEMENDRLKATITKKPEHGLVIGTTGSGKTTMYINNSIQVLSETKTKPSFIISDPKGELVSLHRLSLINKGYDVKVVDLRNASESTRWNPLEPIYDTYQRAIHLEEEVITDEERGCYIFEGKEYYDIEEKNAVVEVVKQRLLDDAYNDLNDIFHILFPITNEKEPVWDTGPRNYLLAIALAMLEDSQDPKLGMTREKFNFFAISRVASRTDNNCLDLINYFKNRNPLSKAVTLSKQVFDASDKTRGSYLSMCFDKLSLFSDSSINSLTSNNEIEFSTMDEKPTALFIIIPDEKETRYALASILITQAYKELVSKASSNKNLTLARPVYFMLDEFGNLPKIPKIQQMVTVSRSRNIFFSFVIQSYSQLNQVYGDNVASIIMSNCNIQIFIGTTDSNSITDFSKRLGNCTTIQTSYGLNTSKSDDINANISLKERPVLYPSELQLLNCNGSLGNAIVTIFGYNPIKSKYIPSFKCNEFNLTSSSDYGIKPRAFDESKAYYDIDKRNSLYEVRKESKPQQLIVKTERAVNRLLVEQVKQCIKKGCDEVLDEDEVRYLLNQVDLEEYEEVIDALDKAKLMATESNRLKKVSYIEDALKRLNDLRKNNKKELKR